MFLIFLLLLLTSSLSAEDYFEQGIRLAEEHSKQKTKYSRKSDKDFLKKQITEIKANTESHYEKGIVFAVEQQTGDKCKVSNSLLDHRTTETMYIFVSFSLADETWITLSKELEKVGGVFVLRGLPDNSFKKLAAKINSLRKQGVQATIQVDPILFTKYKVQNVPCFVATENDFFDKISGNFSLAFALEKMASLGETTLAKTLRKKL